MLRHDFDQSAQHGAAIGAKVEREHHLHCQHLPKLGSVTNQGNAGYTVTKARPAIVSRAGLRPNLSEIAPPIEFQIKFVAASKSVTSAG
ncbi:hypothetical protein ABIA85_009055 [Bradyrhizobium sp. LA6.10]